MSFSPLCSVVRLTVLVVVVTIAAAGCEAERKSLPEACYSDVHCLVAAAASRADAVSDMRLQSLVEPLARLGEFKLAQEQIARRKSTWPQTEAARSIVIYQIVRTALAESSEVADLGPIARMDDDPFRASLDRELVVDYLVHKSPSGAMEPRLNDLFRAKVVRRSPNATLAYLLKTNLPEEYAKLTPGEREVIRNESARV
jgi:hypothetical protein